MTKETSEEKLLRYIRRTSLNEVRDMYFNTTWTSYKQLKEYFKESGWTRGELIAADRPGKIIRMHFFGIYQVYLIITNQYHKMN